MRFDQPPLKQNAASVTWIRKRSQKIDHNSNNLCLEKETQIDKGAKTVP